MSWLNTSSFASLAKTALREAQKTIDKALDIKEDAVQTPSSPEEGGAVVPQAAGPVIVSEPGTESTTAAAAALWGSFTGSFFELRPATNTTVAADPVAAIPVLAEQVEEETGADESRSSMTSASSSLTVLSPGESTPARDATGATDAASGATDASDAVSTLLADAIGLSLRAEAERRAESASNVSADEVETTASSDIEIIASPQAGILQTSCEASATTTPPSGRPTDGTPSEASSDDGSCPPPLPPPLPPPPAASLSSEAADQLEQMSCKIQQLSQILEARESQLVEVNRTCSQLTEEAETLRLRVGHDERERAAHADAVRRLTDDFAQRLSALEKRHQQAVAEKEALARQVEAGRGHQELTRLLNEQEQVVAELRQEGEQLSKKHLQQSNVIKKLRAKEKDDEQQLKAAREKNDELSREVERMKKNLSAKEELERTQIEAVRQLTATNAALEKELTANKLVVRDTVADAETLRSARAALDAELATLRAERDARDADETRRTLSAEVALRAQMQLEFEATIGQAQQEKLELTNRLQELGRTLALADAQRAKEREEARKEQSSAMRRLQEAEGRSDELAQALATSTRPLLRQIEALQQSLAGQRVAHEKSERALQERLGEALEQLRSASEKEAAAGGLFLGAEAKRTQLLEQLAQTTQQHDLALQQLAAQRIRNDELAEALERRRAEEEAGRRAQAAQAEAVERRARLLEEALAAETAALDAERQRAQLLADQLLLAEERRAKGTGGTTRGSSPTSSLDKISVTGSLTESFSSNPWMTADDVFDGGLATPVARSTLYDTVRVSSNTVVFENLQSQLKTREGEVQQLQLELRDQERTRESLTLELTKLISANNRMEERLAQLEPLPVQLAELQTNYNALLQMYGEKIEENDELKLDLVDVKDMYKAQIDQLLKT